MPQHTRGWVGVESPETLNGAEPRSIEGRAVTLAALIRKRTPGKLATAIPAIPATQPTVKPASVARIATVAVASPADAKTATDTATGTPITFR